MDRSGRVIRVLHVDDEPELRTAVTTHLEREHDDVVVTTEPSARDGLDRLDSSQFDCIVSDHGMEEMDGLAFLREVRDNYPDLPFILFTGKGNEEIASEAISAGVTEYLQKDDGTDQYAVLANRIERAVSERRARTALKRQETELSTLISNLPGMVYRCRNGRDWPMTFVSEGARDLTGYEADAIESGEINWGEEIIVPEDREQMWAKVQTALDAGEPFEVTYRIETADGERRWMWERGEALTRDDENVILEGFVTDITVRKERERELEDQRAFVENVLNSLDDLFYVTDPDGSLRQWNDRVVEVTGYSDVEISSMNALKFVRPEDRPAAESSIAEAIESGSSRFQAAVETKSGDTISFEFHETSLHDADGDLVGIAGVARDVTERKKRERELERNETILQAVGDPVYTLNEDGVFTLVNDAVEALSGYDRDELIGEHISKIMTEQDVRDGERLIASLLTDADRTNGTFEMDVLTADGRSIPCENHIALLPADEGAFRGTAGVIRDITDRKQREKQLEQFASVVSHDLRSPLNVVQGRVEHVMSTGDLEHLDDVAEAAGQMERLIDDLLTLAREGQRVGEPEEVALDVVAAEVWEQLQPGDVTLQIETDQRVEADYDRLRELFDNLLCNAISHGDATTLRVVETGNGFAVADDGSGIPADRRSNVFERGFTTSQDGTGFGLAIVDTIVQAHDWSIQVAESDDGGARFEIVT